MTASTGPGATRHRAAAAAARRGPAPAGRLDTGGAAGRWLLAAAAAGAAVPVAAWWSDTTSVVGAAGWLTGAGRITGLLAGYGCALLVVLMARIPLLEHRVGTDRVARWHAAAGRYTVCLVLVHATLVIAGYAGSAHTGLVRETATVVLDYPDMVKGSLGALLLIGVGAVSVRAARRRMSYETWYYLHLATYLALFLVFFHQLALGAEFSAHPWLRTAWYVLYVGAGLLVVWFRVLVPVRRVRRHRMRVAEVRPEGPGVVSVFVAGVALDELGAEPGQFFRFRFMVPGLWWTASPYSLSAPVRPDFLRITVKAAGGHSAALARLRPGTRVWAEGPYGAFTARRRGPAARPVLLLAGGVGITPLRALFETVPAAPGGLTLVYRARREADLVLRGELESIAGLRGARLRYVVSEGGRGVPWTGAALAGLVPGLAEHEVWVCGPPGMAEAARAALREAGVPARRVHHESFEF